MNPTPRHDFKGNTQEDDQLRQRFDFNSQQEWKVDANEDAEQETPRFYAGRGRPVGWRIKVLLLCASVIFCWPIVSGIYSWWLVPDIRSTLWAILMLVIGLTIVTLIFAEWRSLLTLRRQQNRAENITQWLEEDGSSMVKHCQEIAKRSGVPEANLAPWKALIKPHHSAQEVLQLYEAEILEPIDAQIKQLIYKWSSESAVMVALSPFAALDMLLVLWRNMRMFNHIAHAYGLRVGLWARMDLIRLVIINITFVGVTEVISDIGLDILGAELTSKVSVRASQGIGAGLLTARLGYKCQQLCRPIPQREGQSPRVDGILKQLTQQVLSLHSR